MRSSWARPPHLTPSTPSPHPTPPHHTTPYPRTQLPLPPFQGGWMRTGDLASIDAEGYCTVVGRIRDMVIRGG